MRILLMLIMLFTSCVARAEDKVASPKPAIERSEAIKLRKIEKERQFEETMTKAEQGDAEAQAAVGSAYIFASGVNRDFAEAEKWLMKSADQGNAKGLVMAGLLYNGNVGNASGLRDYSKALRLFEKAAWQGEPKAYDMLALMYHNGQGVKKDKVESLKWLCLAIKAYNSPLHQNLGARMGLSNMFFNIFEQLSPDEVAEARKRADAWEATLTSKQNK